MARRGDFLGAKGRLITFTCECHGEIITGEVCLRLEVRDGKPMILICGRTNDEAHTLALLPFVRLPGATFVMLDSDAQKN